MPLFEEKRSSYVEIFLLFSVFYLPSYVFSPPVSSCAGTFDSPLFHLQYVVSALPQILFLLYLVEGSGGYRKFGIRGVKPMELAAIVGATALLVAIGLGWSLLVRDLKLPGQPAGPSLTKPAMIPLSALTCIVTGYREELFFRSYMITKMESESAPAWAIYIGTSLLFGLGHSYQGAYSTLLASGIGFLLAAVFRRTRNLHLVAVSHAAYDFTVLLLGLSLAR
jgi:uncharacterized protein